MVDSYMTFRSARTSSNLASVSDKAARDSASDRLASSSSNWLVANLTFCASSRSRVFPRSSRQVASFSSALRRAILTSYDALRSSQSFWWASITKSFFSTSSAWSLSSSTEGWDMDSSRAGQIEDQQVSIPKKKTTEENRLGTN